MFSGGTAPAETVVALLASVLRRDIAFGDLAPDAKLKVELRGRCGGSTHSGREALTLLAAESPVEATAQRGFCVASASESDLRDIVRVRAELEALGLRWFMSHGDVAWEGRVIAAQHAADRATDRLRADPDGAVLDWAALDWDEAGRAPHAALLSTCGSPRMIRMAAQFDDQSRRFWLARPREGSAIRGYRAATVAAIVAGDADTAAAHLLADIRDDLGRNAPHSRHEGQIAPTGAARREDTT